MSDNSQSNPIPFWSARQVILATIFVVAVFLAFWLLFSYRYIILLFFISVVLGIAIRPLVDWLMKRGLSRTNALLITFIALLAAIVAFLLLLVPILTTQLIELSSRVPEVYDQARVFLVNSESRFVRNLAYRLPPQIELLLSQTPSETDPLAPVNQLFTIAGAAIRVVFAVTAVLLLAFFWVLESDRVFRYALLLVPISRRNNAQDLLNDIVSTVGSFVRGQLVLCLSIGVMAYIVYLIIGLPNAIALAVIAGVFEAVPIFGPALGAIPALLVALAFDPTKAIWVIVGTGLIQVTENYLLVPRIMGKSLGVNPIVTLLSLAGFSALFGFVGALLAIPLAAIIQLLLDRFLLAPEANEPNPPLGRDYSSLLRMEAQNLIQDIHKQVRGKDTLVDESADEIEDKMEEIAIELDTFLQEHYADRVSNP